MDRFKNILLFLNTDIKNQAALKCAFSLAKNNDARLKLVGVVKDMSRYQPILPDSAKGMSLHNTLVLEKAESLERSIIPFQKEGVRVSIRVFSGTPFLEIIREVIRKEHDLVVTTPEGKSEFKDMLFGTTTMHLMRKCPCPVWVIKPESDASFPRILAAVDPDPDEKETMSLNSKILEMSSSLAEMQKSELHVVHVWDFHIGTAMVPRNITDDAAEEIRTIHKSWFDDLLMKHVPHIPQSHTHLIRGEAATRIPRLANEKDVDLIVMGTVSRTGIPGFFMGNTAERILYRVDCSVLAVKPDGFITPVEVNK